MELVLQVFGSIVFSICGLSLIFQVILWFKSGLHPHIVPANQLNQPLLRQQPTSPKQPTLIQFLGG